MTEMYLQIPPGDYKARKVKTFSNGMTKWQISEGEYKGFHVFEYGGKLGSAVNYFDETILTIGHTTLPPPRTIGDKKYFKVKITITSSVITDTWATNVTEALNSVSLDCPDDHELLKYEKEIVEDGLPT